MTYYFKKGPSYRPTDESNVDLRTFLPPGNYLIKQDPMDMSLFFETVDTFTFKAKRYGDNVRHTTRILDTFLNRDASTGVMLAGEKGSGKSLLAKTVCIEALKQDIPTIIINAAWRGDAFNALIQGVEQPAIVLFDEFEKVYDADEQEQILTLLDGVFPTKKLFVFTCNDKWRVDSHMRNRPGRIFYMIDFKGLDATFIEEYCADTLHNKEHTPDICRLANVFSEFNFDMLKSLVEEMNRYGESPAQALEMLNVRPEYDSSIPNYSMTLTRNGQVLKLYQKEFAGNPFSDDIKVNYCDPDLLPTNTDDEDDDVVKAPSWNGYIMFENDTLTTIKDHILTFQKDGLVITLTRKERRKSMNWLDAL